MADPVLHTHRLSRRFGGLVAVDEVSLGCEPGQVHDVIGPNGAGKSTLINLLAGELPASDGQVWFSFLPPAGTTLASAPGAVLARMAPGGSPTVLSDRADTTGSPVLRMASGHDAGIWLAEGSGTLARVNLTSVPSFT